MRSSNIAVAVTSVFFGLFWLYESSQLQVLTPSGQTGGGFVPAALSIILVGLGSLLLVVSLVKRQLLGALVAEEPEDKEEGSISRWRPFALFGILTLSILLFKPLGFVVSMMLLMAAVTIGLERRKLVGSIANSVLIPLAMGLIFGTLLGVRLPTLDLLGFSL